MIVPRARGVQSREGSVEKEQYNLLNDYMSNFSWRIGSSLEIRREIKKKAIIRALHAPPSNLYFSSF